MRQYKITSPDATLRTNIYQCIIPSDATLASALSGRGYNTFRPDEKD